ncbi:MAG: hypothetical protein C0594_00040 [Marinilabiliales bacterium]|nr:MAG: hypothetical protein C0594_00040 [Marinilabiliales bacterium]
MKYKITVLSTILILLLVNLGQAQLFKEYEKITKAYSVGPGMTVEVDNKYGKLHVVPWNKDSVRFDIEILTEGDSEEKMEKINDNIKIDFTETSFYIVAKTDFGTKYSGFFGDIKELAESISSSNREVEINYIIYIPEYVDLKLTNKYGDIYSSNLKGNVNIQLSNGDLKLNNLSGNADINVRFGDAVINSVNDARISLYFSELFLKKGKNLNFDTKSSKITVEQSEILKITSKRDKYYLQQVKNIYGNSSFSDFWIYDINKESNFTVKYGHFNMEYIQPEFSIINLTSKYSDINLFFDKKAAFNFDICYEDTELMIPAENSTVENKILEGDEKKKLSIGNIGSGKTNSVLKIASEEGSINIFLK